MASAKFQLSPSGGLSWLATDVALASGNGIALGSGNASVYARLASTAGVDTVDWSITSASENAPIFTVTQYPDKSVRMLVPIDSAATWILRAVVNGGVDPLTKRASVDLVSALAIKVLTSGGSELLAPGEGDEGDRTFGWTTAFNALASAGIGAGTATRLRANAASYLSGDVTLAEGTNITLTQVGSTITFDATGGGGSALPSPYTATLETYETIADSLVITGPAGAYTTADPPNVVVRGRDNSDVANSRDGGNAVLRGGDLAAGNTNGGEGGSAVVQGGTGNIAGSAFLQGGLTSTEGETAGNAGVLAGSGPDHGSLTNVHGGTVNVYAGTGKGSGDGGQVLLAAGYSYTGSGGLLQASGGSTGDAGAGGNAYWRAGDSADGTGGAAEVTGGSGGAGGGAVTVQGGNGTAGYGGPCVVAGGAGAGGASGGTCSVAGGDGGATGDGGDASLRGGPSTASTGGIVEVFGGTGLLAGGAASLVGGVGLTNGDGGSCSVRGGYAYGTGTGGTLSLSGGAGRQPGDVRIAGGGHTTGTDEAGGSVYVRGGEGNANYGGAVSISGGEGDAGGGGDLELFVGLDSAGTYSHGVLRFGVGGAEATPTVTKDYSTTHLTEASTANATPAQHFTTTVPDHCVYTIVSVSHARTTSASDGGTVGRRSTWRRNGASVTQIGVTKSLTDADEDNGFSVTHTPDTAAVDVNAVGKAATTVYWRHTVQVLMHSVGS